MLGQSESVEVMGNNIWDVCVCVCMGQEERWYR